MDLSTWSEALDAGYAGGVARVAAAGDDQEVSLRAPAVLGAKAECFGRLLDRIEAGVGSPAADGAGPLVVALVGGGALIDRSIGPNADLDSLPVIPVVTRLAGDRDATKGGGVRIVGPVVFIAIEV